MADNAVAVVVVVAAAAAAAAGVSKSKSRGRDFSWRSVVGLSESLLNGWVWFRRCCLRVVSVELIVPVVGPVNFHLVSGILFLVSLVLGGLGISRSPDFRATLSFSCWSSLSRFLFSSSNCFTRRLISFASSSFIRA